MIVSVNTSFSGRRFPSPLFWSRVSVLSILAGALGDFAVSKVANCIVVFTDHERVWIYFCKESNVIN